MKSSHWMAALALSVSVVGAAAQESITAYNVYKSAPFVLDTASGKPGEGLAYDLVNYLNAKLKGKYQLTLENVPRERLNQTVIDKPDFKGIVLFLNPMFMVTR